MEVHITGSERNAVIKQDDDVKITVDKIMSMLDGAVVIRTNFECISRLKRAIFVLLVGERYTSEKFTREYYLSSTMTNNKCKRI